MEGDFGERVRLRLPVTGKDDQGDMRAVATEEGEVVPVDGCRYAEWQRTATTSSERGRIGHRGESREPRNGHSDYGYG
jgi:hypothetical protein